ncbi:MAG: chitobiase/beta-hexosaminidase C-terminal domain-containing protein [Paludibacteraceae bacterium]|nr:chitobiase/beta-hexosaminidase C-terminal domain-containing protein [Paludibacteraceae bacterium]
MRKFFSFLMAVLFAGSMMATDVTLVPGDFTEATSAATSATVSGVTAAISTGSITTDQIRIFKTNTITISVETGVITKVVFTCAATGANQYGPGCFAAQTGYTYETDGNTGTWTGEASSVSFTASTNQVRATQIVVTTGTVAVAAPVISPTEETFFDNVDVTLSCTTSGADIYYTLDGTDPNDLSNEYDYPFTIYETTTVKAIAYSGTQKSSITSKTFTKIEKQSCANVISSLTGSSSYLEDVTVTWSDGNKNVWVKDATGSLLIYFSSGAVSFEPGDVISGLYGEHLKYNTEIHELKTYQAATDLTVTSGTAPAAEIFNSIPTTSDINKFIEIKGATVVAGSFTTETILNLNLSLDGETIVLRNQFKQAYTFENGKQYNVKALVSYYSDALQLYFVSAEEKPAETYATLYFVKPNDWLDEIYAYVWNNTGDGELNVWPGDYMSNTYEQINGLYIYSYNFPTKYDNIIFTDGTNQTVDLTWDESTPYFYNGAWYAYDDIPVSTKKHYEVQLYPPTCSLNTNDLPAITGNFNTETDPIPMHTGWDGTQNYYYYEFEAEPGDIVQFFEAYAGTTNPLEFYDAVTESWGTDIVLPETSNASEIVVLDQTDNYRWNKCITYNVAVVLFPPTGVPDAGIEIIGSFAASEDWSKGIQMTENEGAYIALLTDVLPTDVFKFREAGTWDNEPMYYDSDANNWYVFSNFTFGDIWVDAGSSGIPGYEKYIGFDWSNEAMYKWKQPKPDCYFTLQMTDSYGDGWNGASITVSDGDFSQDYTLSGGSSDEVNVPYFGKDMTLTWNSGSWDSEVGFTILLPNGYGLFKHNQGSGIADGTVFFTLDVSPCVSGANPFNPNVQAEVTEDNKLRVTWDAIEGVAFYQVRIYTPQGNEITNNASVTVTSYLSIPLALSGEYTIVVTSFNDDDLQLGSTSVTEDIVIPSITEPVSISVFAPTDCNMDVSGGLWLVWRPGGTDDWNEPIAMSTSDGQLFTSGFVPNAPSYDYYVINAANQSDATGISSWWENLTDMQHCSEILWAPDGSEHGLKVNSSCAFTDHNYAITSTSSLVAPGVLRLSWTAADMDDQYYVEVYKADGDQYIYGDYAEGVPYNLTVGDGLDGVEVYWTVQPVSPYMHAAVRADNVTLQKNDESLSLVSGEVTTSDNKSLHAEWEFSQTDLHYLVEVYYGGQVIHSAVVTTTSYDYELAFFIQANLAVLVTPLNSSTGDLLCQPINLGSIYLENAPQAIDNFQGSATDHHLTYTWTSLAPKVKATFYQKLSNGTWNYLSATETIAETLEFDVAEDGEYILELQPYYEVSTGNYLLISRYFDCQVLVFTKNTFTVTVTATAGGTIDPEELADGVEYAEGYTINVSAYPEEGYYFEQWSDGVTGYPRTLYVDGDITLQAIFKPLVTLTVSSNDESMGYVEVSDNYYDDLGSGVYTFIPGTEVQLNAIQVSGYEFIKWSDDVLTYNRSFIITENVTLQAIFDVEDTSVPTHFVDIYSFNEDMGTVNNVSGYWKEGKSFEVTATPKPGFRFVKWSDENTENPRIFTVGTADIEIYATFEAETYTLKLIAGEGGSVDPSTEVTDIAYGEKKAIKALADPGYEFLKWSDNIPFAERQITIVQDCTLTAYFQATIVPITQFTFALGTNIGNGTVTSSIPEGDYDPDTEITVTANAADGWEFVKWSNESTENPLTFNLTSDVTIYAVFKEQGVAPTKYVFSFEATALGGTVASSEPNGTYEEGKSITLTATPNTDWEFVVWVVNGVNASNVNPLTITLTENISVSAIFTTSKKYKVTIKVGPDKGGTVDPKITEKEYNGGAALDIKAIPDEDYKFVEWKEDGNTDAERTIVITQDTVLTAIFAEIVYYQLKVVIDPEEAGTVLFDGKVVKNLSKSYAEGTTVKLTAEPETGYVFDHFEDGNNDITTDVYNVKMDKKRTITAVFVKDTRDLNNIDATEHATKILINGEIYILRGDKIYTVQGQIVK